jgi:glycosyltransferase involved in cell wall biosynthesis
MLRREHQVPESRAVAVSAYACRPGWGSEPGIGWHTARHLAADHRVLVLTRTSNRAFIEAGLADLECGNLQFLFIGPDDPPHESEIARNAHYYLWQIRAFLVLRHVLKTVPIDVVHHVTYGRYWSPSYLALLRRPFVWGPVGGGETTPPGLMPLFTGRERRFERIRTAARHLGEADPLVRLMAARSSVAFATTEQSAQRMRMIGARDVRVHQAVGLSTEELSSFERLPAPHTTPFRFISMGRLLHWKGFDLGLNAFAQAHLPESEYWVVGDGPEYSRLNALAARLGIQHRVRFLGQLERPDALKALSMCHVLVHPSTHDSGGFVCAEALAAGRPVICLNTGGPAEIIDATSGALIDTSDVDTASGQIAEAMVMLSSPTTYVAFSSAARKRAGLFRWDRRVKVISNAIAELAPASRGQLSRQ